MWDFKFDAPQYHNFFRKQKRNNCIQIDPTDPNDIWFMQQHVQLTPIKQAQIQKQQIKIIKSQIVFNSVLSVNYQIKKVHESKSKQESNNNKIGKLKNDQNKNTLKPITQKLKRSHISQKSQQSSSSITFGENKMKRSRNHSQIQFNKIPIKREDKISKVKSEIIHQKSKIRMPCPYPRKVQRQWEDRSQKAWYSLSQQSAKKAMQSMKKIGENRKKSPKQNKQRFKF